MKQAEYIKSIEIKALWKGGKHIKWDLHPDVNILSGINGVGKSTIINYSAKMLKQIHNGEIHAGDVAEGVTVKFYPEDATFMKFDVIRSFDRPLLNSSLLGNLSEQSVRTELDLQIYKLQKRYLDYQVNIGNKIIELLTSGNQDDQMKAALVSVPKTKFQNIIDELFKDTNKVVDRKNNEIQFIQNGEVLTPYQLSSGEKQMLVIMMTVLLEDGEHCALLMDEPEISLHVEWQKALLGLIRELNPNAQVILSTHSPALIMDGWMDLVTEVEDVTVNDKDA